MKSAVLFFRKSSRPSLLIKRAALGNLKASFHCTHWHRFFPLKRAPPLTPTLSPSGKKRETAPPRRSEPLRSKVGGPSKVSPDCTGWDRLGMSGASKPSPCCAGWDRLGIAVYSLRLISWLFADNLQISCDFLGGFEEKA